MNFRLLSTNLSPFFSLVLAIVAVPVLISTGFCKDTICEGTNYEFQFEKPKWSGTVHAEYRGGSRHVGKYGATIPLTQDETSLLFLDFRGRFDDDGVVNFLDRNFETQEYNLGLVYRKILDSKQILGVYGFYDFKTEDTSNEFHQGTLGVELLGTCWDFRVNGYLPTDLGREDAGRAPIFGQRFEERALWGVDYEVGRLLGTFGESCHELRAFAGGYFFDNYAAGFPQLAGPRVRLEMRLFDLAFLGDGSRLTASAEFQHDDVRDSQGFGGIQVQIPLGKGKRDSGAPCLTPLQRRMLDPVVRDIDIITMLRTTGNPNGGNGGTNGGNGGTNGGNGGTNGGGSA